MTLAPERPAARSHQVDHDDPREARQALSPTAEHEHGSVHAKAEHHAGSSRLGSATAPTRVHLPKKSGKPNPFGELTNDQIDAIGRELDAIRAEVMDSRGASDAAYIRKVIKIQRYLELSSRAVLLFSGVKVKGIRPAWWVGVAGLSLAKIIENMEIGHNVMHGQWDWMRDPKIHSTAWEWDNASPSSQWKHAHNEIHHTFTNVLGRDNDLGYGILRVDEDQPWSPFFLFQPIWHVGNAAMFEYSIAAYDLELGGYLQRRHRMSDDAKAAWRKDANEVLAKIKRQATKDYLVHPLLSGPSALHTLTANLTANLMRNLWTNTVIICGHFPEGISTFESKGIDEESRGEWYLRQMLGSGNISGSKLLHVMTGNLSHQIEHHLYPDMPSNRYAEVAPKVRAIMDRHNLPYVTGSLAKQAASVYKKVVLLSLPPKEQDRSRPQIIIDTIKANRAKKKALKAKIARAKEAAARRQARTS